MGFFSNRSKKYWYEASTVEKLRNIKYYLENCDDQDCPGLLQRRKKLVNSFASLKSLYMLRVIISFIANIFIVFATKVMLNYNDHIFALGALYVIVSTPLLASLIGQFIKGYLDNLEAEIDQLVILAYNHSSIKLEHPTL